MKFGYNWPSSFREKFGYNWPSSFREKSFEIVDGRRSLPIL